MESLRVGYHVRFTDGQVFSAVERREKTSAFHTALADHHGRADHDVPAFCLCQGAVATETKLYIARRERTGTYHLARYPNSGAHHATDCEFYELPRETSGLDGYDVSVVQQLVDGTLKVKLRRPLRKNLQPTVASETHLPAGAPATGRRSQTAMTTRGILDLLWQQADLNVWWPGMRGKRHVGVVHYHLVLAGRRVRASRDLIDDVAVYGFGDLAPFHFKEMARRNARVLDDRWRLSTPKEMRLVLFIGPLQGVKETVTGFRLVMEGLAAQKINLEVSGKLLEGLTRMFPPFARLRQDTRQSKERVVGLFHARIIERPKDGWTLAEVDAGAVISTNEQWIPVESSYERTLADFLIEKDRSFIKPLRYDASLDVVFPDFLLTDGGAALVPMEVWGRDDPDYLERQTVKIATYEALYPDAVLWEWDVSESPTPPALPPRKPRAGHPVNPTPETPKQ